MNSIKGSSLGLYFTKSEDPYKVRCKICRRLLSSGRRNNLKQHLQHSHRIEVRLKRKSKFTAEQDFIKPEIIDDPAAASSDPLVVNEALEDNEHILSDDVPPLPLLSVTQDPNSSLGSNKRDNGQILIDDPIQKSVTKKRTYKTKSTPIPNMTEEPQQSSNEDSFDEVFRKRKQFTELENLQMQNYKLKLELWAMEQKLQVKSSKYTKDIVGLHSSPS